MPASSAELRAKWRKRKRDQAARRAKLKEQVNDDTFEDNEDDEDNDLDPPRNHLETEDYSQHQSVDHMTHSVGKKESEKLVDGGLRICEFPTAIKREVTRPHSSVFRIVEAERAARNGYSRAQGQCGVAFLENISYGQLQALSAVPRDSPTLNVEEIASGSGVGSYVITPPPIIAGSGVTKRLGSAGRVHVVPAHSDWFSPNSVHRLERQVVPHFFSGKSAEHTPEMYMEARNFIVAKYMENPEKQLAVSDCHGITAGIDNADLTRIVMFLDHWGIINYCAMSLKHEARKLGSYLCEDSNGELRVPSAALKSIDSLIKFDSPKCRLKAGDVYPELSCQRKDDSDLDSTIREQLSEQQCSCCSQPIPMVYYQSQKEVDVRLCLECYNDRGFSSGHSSLDFVKENSIKDYEDVDGDSWSDQETLRLLEGMQLYKENWNRVAEHVGSKSKAECILHFVRLPLDGVPLDNIDVPSTSGSSTAQNHANNGRAEPNSNGYCSRVDDAEDQFPFSNSENPVMHLVAFLASALGPRVAAACAHASLASLSKDSGKEGNLNGDLANSNTKGPWSQQDGHSLSLSADKVRAAAKDGLAAAAVKAKLFADHEEREIQRLSANIINHQLKRLELKLKQFAEVETLLMRECEQMERTRQRIAAERGLMGSTQFGSAIVSRPLGLSASAAVNQPMHPPHMSVIQQQQGMYGLGARLPLSAIQPLPSASSNAPTSALGHQMLGPFSGSKSALG